MNILFLIGRIIFGGYFIYSAYSHFSHVANMAAYAGSKGVPAPQLAIIVTGLLLLIGGISVILGAYPSVGLICLIVFLVPVTFMMHAFWADSDPMAKMGNVVNFGKNLALVGALLMMFAIRRPWPWSVIK